MCQSLLFSIRGCRQMDGGDWIPSRPRRVRFYGVPLHTWREVFRLLGDCLGSTLEVDQLTSSKEVLTHGRVKVLVGKVRKLSIQILLWVGNL